MSKRKVTENAENDTRKKANKAAPKTLKDKILDLLANQDTLVGLPTIKSVLAADYGVSESAANNKKINQTLKDLLDEKRNVFGKIGGSYHGGESSPAYLSHIAASLDKEQQEEAKTEGKNLEGEKPDLRCPTCRDWGKYGDFEIIAEERDGLVPGTTENLHFCPYCSSEFKVTTSADGTFFYSYGPKFSKVVDQHGCYY